MYADHISKGRVKEKFYTSSEQFDKDMSKLFLKGRRSYAPASEGYGQVLLLQVGYTRGLLTTLLTNSI